MVRKQKVTLESIQDQLVNLAVQVETLKTLQPEIPGPQPEPTAPKRRGRPPKASLPTDKMVALENLLTDPTTESAIRKQTKLTQDEIKTELVKLESEGKVINVGSKDAPVWVRRVGDDAAADVLRDTLEKLVAIRPMSLPELISATGARQGRVSGLIGQLKNQEKVTNIGSARRALWWVPRK